MMSKGQKANSLTMLQRYNLMKWIDENRDIILNHTDRESAKTASEALNFKVHDNQMCNARTSLGILKLVVTPAARNHVEYTDEETQVRITALAHAQLTLFKLLGEDHRQCARRIVELFPELGGVV